MVILFLPLINKSAADIVLSLMCVSIHHEIRSGKSGFSFIFIIALPFTCIGLTGLNEAKIGNKMKGLLPSVYFLCICFFVYCIVCMFVSFL